MVQRGFVHKACKQGAVHGPSWTLGKRRSGGTCTGCGGAWRRGWAEGSIVFVAGASSTMDSFFNFVIELEKRQRNNRFKLDCIASHSADKIFWNVCQPTSEIYQQRAIYSLVSF